MIGNDVNYPPITLMRQIGERWPDCWRKLRVAAASARFADCVAPWCPMPVMLAPTIYMDAEMSGVYDDAALRDRAPWLMPISPVYLWRLTKGIYKFSPELYAALIDQPLDGDLPFALFDRLPEWCVYIDTPCGKFDGGDMDGFFANIDANLETGGKDLQLCMILRGQQWPRTFAIPAGDGNIDDALQRVAADDVRQYAQRGVQANPIWHTNAAEARRNIVSMLQLILYLCSDDPDMPQIQHPRSRPRKTAGFAAQDARVWDVGIRIGAAIRAYNNQAAQGLPDGNGAHASPRPHVRRAHWHSFWTGPKDSVADRRLVLKWLPPIPVGMPGDDEPAVIHAVK